MKTKNQKEKFPKESAGRRMVENVPTCYPEEKILDIRKKLLEKAKEFETLNYIYVVDKEKKLVGVFSIKEVFQRPEKTKVEDLMERRIIKVGPYTDQERVVILALKNNLKSIPVVNKEGYFFGAVPSDTILEILHSEHMEDFLRLAGIRKNGYFPEMLIKTPAGILAKRRLPWFFLGLLGGIFAAQIVNFFETSLGHHLILAAFIPLIVYMADAVGAQAQTLFIRSLAIDQGINLKKYLVKEIKTSFLMALILGILLSLIALIWFTSPLFGLILGISLFLTVIFSSLIDCYLNPLVVK